jgi:hypothetical protein
MNTDYREKYLKYKIKYLDLKGNIDNQQAFGKKEDKKKEDNYINSLIYIETLGGNTDFYKCKKGTCKLKGLPDFANVEFYKTLRKVYEDIMNYVKDILIPDFNQIIILNEKAIGNLIDEKDKKGKEIIKNPYFNIFNESKEPWEKLLDYQNNRGVNEYMWQRWDDPDALGATTSGPNAIPYAYLLGSVKLPYKRIQSMYEVLSDTDDKAFNTLSSILKKLGGLGLDILRPSFEKIIDNIYVKFNTAFGNTFSKNPLIKNNTYPSKVELKNRLEKILVVDDKVSVPENWTKDLQRYYDIGVIEDIIYKCNKKIKVIVKELELENKNTLLYIKRIENIINMFNNK